MGKQTLIIHGIKGNSFALLFLVFGILSSVVVTLVSLLETGYGGVGIMLTTLGRAALLGGIAGLVSGVVLTFLINFCLGLIGGIGIEVSWKEESAQVTQQKRSDLGV